MILQLWSLLTAGSYVVVSLYAPRSWDLVSRLGLVIPCGSALTVAISYLMKGRTLDLAKKLDVAPEAYSRKLTQSAQQGTMPQQVQTAVEDGNVDRVRAVMDAGINVNACTAEGKAMLHLAAQAGQAEVIRLLLSHSDNRADIHARDADGRTALHLAAAAGQGVGVKILLERGAPLEAKDLKGLTPLELAKETGHRGCELLMKRAMDRPLSSLMASEKLTQRLAPSVSASPV